MKFFAVVCVVVSLVQVAPAYGWGQNGHRIVGQIASEHLTKTTAKAIQQILAEDSLAEVSTWADVMRSDSEIFWQKNSTRWHYINYDITQGFDHEHYHLPQSKAEVQDIYGALLLCVRVLQAGEAYTLSEREFYLRFLVHLVGDLHQPMHVGNAHDRGGNQVTLTFFGKTTNLHTLWDSELVESQGLSFSEYARFINTNDAQRIRLYLAAPPEEWLRESKALSEQIYRASSGGDYGYQYLYEFIPTVNQRLQQAGIRLAGLLNSIFDGRAKPGITGLVAAP